MESSRAANRARAAASRSKVALIGEAGRPRGEGIGAIMWREDLKLASSRLRGLFIGVYGGAWTASRPQCLLAHGREFLHGCVERDDLSAAAGIRHQRTGRQRRLSWRHRGRGG